MDGGGSSTFSKDVANIISAGLLTDFIDYLKRKARNSQLAELIKDKVGYVEINEQAKELISKAAAKARNQYPVESSDLRTVLNDDRNRKIIYKILLNDFQKEDLNDLVDEFNYKKYITHHVERKRFEKFLGSFFNNLQNLKESVYSFESQEILKKLSEIQDTIGSFDKRMENIEKEVKRIPGYFDNQKISNFLDHKIEEIEQLKKSDQLNEVRKKAKQFLDDIPDLDKSNWEALAKTNLIIAQTYLDVEDQDIQVKAKPYLDQAINFTEDKKKKKELSVLRCLIENEFKEGLKIANEALKEDAENNELKSYKAQILSGLGKVEPAVEIAKEIDEHSLISRFYYRAQDYKKAEKYYQKYTTDKENINDILFYADIIGGKFQNKSQPIGEELFKLLRNTAKKIEQKIQENEETLPEKSALLKSKLGIFYHWLGLNSKCYRYLKEAYSKQPDNKSILYNLIHAALDNNLNEDAIFYIQKYLDKWDNKDLNYLKFELLINQKQKNDISKELRKILDNKDTPDSDKKSLFPLYVKSLIKKIEIGKAEEFLDEMADSFGKSAEYKISKAILFDEIGKNKEMINCLEDAIEVDDDDYRKVKNKRILADVLFNERDKDSITKARKIYQEISTPYKNDLNLRRLALCYYLEGDYKECLKLCEEAISIHNEDLEQFLELKTTIHLENESFPKAEESLRTLIEQSESKVKYRVHLINCLYRQGKVEDAEDLLRATRNKIEDGDENLILISNAQLELGNYEDALEDSYRALQNDSTTLKTYFYYFQIYLDITLAKPSLVKKGDKYYQAAFEAKKVLLESDSEDFFLKEIQVPTNDLEALKDKLVKHLPSSDSIEKIINTYDEFRLPLTSLSKALNKDIYKLYQTIKQNNLVKIWANSGQQQDFKRQYQYGSEAENIIIDLVSLLTLQELNLLDKLSESFNEVYVNQATYDVLNNSRVSLSRGSENGELLLHSLGGNIGTSVIPEQTINQFKTNINAITSFIRKSNNVELIGKSVGREDALGDLNQDDELNDLIGKENVEAIEEANHLDCYLYSDQQTIRLIGDNINIKSFGICGFLRRVLDNNTIGEEKYHTSLIGLLKLNYNFLPINPLTLTIGCKQSGYLSTSCSLAAFEFLKQEDISIQSLFSIVTAFLNWLWNVRKHSIHMKQKWTNILFKNFVTGRINDKYINDFFQNPESYIVVEGQHQEDFLNTINSWRGKLTQKQ